MSNELQPGAYIFMRKLFHQLNFTQNTLCVHRVFKGSRDFLDGNFLTSFLIKSGYNNSIRTMTNGADQRVSGFDLQCR